MSSKELELFTTLVLSFSNKELAETTLPVALKYLEYVDKFLEHKKKNLAEDELEKFNNFIKSWPYRSTYKTTFFPDIVKFKDFSGAKPVVDFIKECYIKYMGKYGGVTYNKEPSIFINEIYENDEHTTHVHPSSDVAGTFYLKVPPGSAPIVFHDPRPFQMYCTPTMTTTLNKYNAPVHPILPKEGELLIWHSATPHAVPPSSKNKEPRISLVFNI